MIIIKKSKLHAFCIFLCLMMLSVIRMNVSSIFILLYVINFISCLHVQCCILTIIPCKWPAIQLRLPECHVNTTFIELNWIEWIMCYANKSRMDLLERKTGHLSEGSKLKREMGICQSKMVTYQISEGAFLIPRNQHSLGMIRGTA